MNKQKEIELISELIQHPAGFNIELAGVLTLRRYEHPIYVIEWEQDYNPCEKENKWQCIEFNDPKKAAECFVELRYLTGLGLDIEKLQAELTLSDNLDEFINRFSGF